MKFTFIVSFYFAVVNMVVASDAIIWRQELECDPNSRCKPNAIAVDAIENKVIILGTSEEGSTRETNFWLWKVSPDGNIAYKKSLGSASQYESLIMGSVGMKAMARLNNGDIARLTMDGTNSASLSINDRNMQSHIVKLKVTRKKSESLLWHDMASSPDGNLLFVGQEGLNGTAEKIDLAGNVIWEKIFDRGQTEILSSVVCIPDSNEFCVAGISVSVVAGKMAFAGPATICVLRYDSNGELKTSDYFEGGIAPWPTSFPKVICLSSGAILVVYDKSKNGKATELYVKTYTRELKPLSEKQILQTKEDSPPASFDVCAIPEDRFAFAGVINYRDLRLYECKADGTILQTLELDGEVGARGVCIDYLAGKIFVAFTARPKENTKGTKIELLALKPYKTN